MSDPSPTLAELRAAFVEGCREMNERFNMAVDGEIIEQWAAERYPDPSFIGMNGTQYRVAADGWLEYRRDPGTAEANWTRCHAVETWDVPAVAALLAQHRETKGVTQG